MEKKKKYIINNYYLIIDYKNTLIILVIKIKVFFNSINECIIISYGLIAIEIFDVKNGFVIDALVHTTRYYGICARGRSCVKSLVNMPRTCLCVDCDSFKGFSIFEF